ncbi:MAG TPA: TonB-dependent receptor [Methylibium sp.]|nr:TonB-dependent receptor [Methylibium sp.]
MRSRYFASGVLLHALCTSAALAQTTTLEPVRVTGNPLGSDGPGTPASVLAGPELLLRRTSSLGETLNGLPGVSAGGFGPNASRPVIRGLDGDRVRMLNNAGATLDASALSFDHAVPLDPLAIERVEVLRGPAALLYGGSAIGGVVNVIDNRIPDAPVEGPGGAVELRGGGAARERGASALLETGGTGIALHADAFGRRTDDLRVPAFDRPAESGSERRRRIVNSASEAEGGALGGSLLWDRGHLGVAVDTYRNDYGIVAEDDVTIRMRRDKLALAGEWRRPDGPLRTLRGRLQFTDYEHREVEGDGAVGTTFRNRGRDARVEFVHAPLGALEGVVGLQAEDAEFEALGKEAFVPGSSTRQLALFAHEELALEGVSQLSFGARVERSRIASDGDAAGTEPRFGAPQRRRFTAGSVALGGIKDLAGWLGRGWSASANLAYTERAPTHYELYADGLHIATAAYERGDPALRKERGRNLDLALEWKDGPSRLRAGVFASRYAHYIALLPSGEADVEDGGEFFPVYAFRGVKAGLSGIELEAARRVFDGTSGTLDLDAQLDAVRATNRRTGEPLPRIPPRRVKLGASWAHGGWTLHGDIVRAAAQDRVPDDDLPTAGYTLVNLSASKRFALGGSEALAFLRIDNLGDELAYNAGSIATVRWLAPLPGRSVVAGLRVSF